MSAIHASVQLVLSWCGCAAGGCAPEQENRCCKICSDTLSLPQSQSNGLRSWLCHSDIPACSENWARLVILSSPWRATSAASEPACSATWARAVAVGEDTVCVLVCCMQSRVGHIKKKQSAPGCLPTKSSAGKSQLKRFNASPKLPRHFMPGGLHLMKFATGWMY